VTQYPLIENPMETASGDQAVAVHHRRVSPAMPSRKRKGPKSSSVEFLFDVHLLTKRLLMRMPARQTSSSTALSNPPSSPSC
jgi:hypothetical protein